MSWWSQSKLWRLQLGLLFLSSRQDFSDPRGGLRFGTGKDVAR